MKNNLVKTLSGAKFSILFCMPFGMLFSLPLSISISFLINRLENPSKVLQDKHGLVVSSFI